MARQPVETEPLPWGMVESGEEMGGVTKYTHHSIVTHTPTLHIKQF